MGKSLPSPGTMALFSARRGKGGKGKGKTSRVVYAQKVLKSVGKGGKGKGKKGGKSRWIPDHIFYAQKALRSGIKGGKGKGKKGKSVMKRGNKSAGKGRTRVPYSELSEEKKEEIRAKHEARAMEEGREEDSSGFHF